MRRGPATASRTRPRAGAGFTLVEILVVAVIASVLIGSVWALFTSTYKRVVKTQSSAGALGSALVLLERFGRDVQEMGHPPCLDRFPTRIATDAAAIAFLIPVRPVDTRSRLFAGHAASADPLPFRGPRGR